MTGTPRLALVFTLVALGAGALTSTASAGIWTQIDSGLGAGATDIIKSIDYQSDSRFWYVTSSGKFAYREAGVFKLGVPASPTAAVAFTEVAFQPGTDVGIAIGTNGNVWRSTNGGRNWTKIPISTYDDDCSGSHNGAVPTTADPGTLRALAWGSGNRVYIGGDKATLLRSTNAGSSFTEINKFTVPDPSFAGWNNMRCRVDAGKIQAIEPIDVPAGTLDNARPMFVMGDGYLWFSADGLASAASKRSAIGFFAPERTKMVIDQTNTNRLWVMSSDISNAIYGSTDGGSSYGSSVACCIKNENGSSFASPQDFAGAGQLTLVSVGKAGQIVTSTDGGTSWFYQRADGTNSTRDWYAVSGYDAAHFAVGGNEGTLLVSDKANTVPDIVAPSGTIGGPTSVAAGQAATYTASLADNAGGSGIDPNSVVWTVAGFPEQRGLTATYTFPAIATHSLKVIFRDLAGNAGEATLVVSVTAPLKLPTFTFPATSKPPATARRVGRYVVVRIKGSFKVPAGIDKTKACNGKVIFTVFRGKKSIASGKGKLSSKCGFSKTLRVPRSKVRSSRRLKVRVRFFGNTVLRASQRDYTVRVRAR